MEFQFTPGGILAPETAKLIHEMQKSIDEVEAAQSEFVRKLQQLYATVASHTPKEGIKHLRDAVVGKIKTKKVAGKVARKIKAAGKAGAKKQKQQAPACGWSPIDRRSSPETIGEAADRIALKNRVIQISRERGLAYGETYNALYRILGKKYGFDAKKEGERMNIRPVAAVFRAGYGPALKELAGSLASA